MRPLKQLTERLYSMKCPSTSARALLAVMLALSVCSVRGQWRPSVFVPYEDMAELIDPNDKAVLMDRTEFAELLARAEANAEQIESRNIAQVNNASYAATIVGDKLSLTGTLEILSMSEAALPVPLHFGRIGLTSVELNGEPAPLGYDSNGKLTTVVTGKGVHRVSVAGRTTLKELTSGGMQFSISIPQAVAGHMTLSVAGDVEIHSTVPAGKPSYDKTADQTRADLTLGGCDSVTVVVLGNGRRQDDSAILLGKSAVTVNLSRPYQIMSCLYTVQALRRGVRQLSFELPAVWTVADVTCPDLVKWSVDKQTAGADRQRLQVRLRSAKVGTTVLNIKATAGRRGDHWSAPGFNLVNAAYERGYLIVATDEGIGVRGEALDNARRQDASAIAGMAGLVQSGVGRLYFHWGRDWSVQLEMATVEVRSSVKEQQRIAVSSKQLTLKGLFEVTAIDRELFTMSFLLGGSSRQWQLTGLTVDASETGFDYRLDESPEGRELTIELAKSIRPEKMVPVEIVMEHIPQDWVWPSDAAPRTETVPFISSRAENVSGLVSVSASGNLDTALESAPDQLKKVPVGRMASLGMGRDVQQAYTYNESVSGAVSIEISRRRPRVAASSIGVVSVRPEALTGTWRLTYEVSRASTRRLYLLTNKKLGEELNISSPTAVLTSRSIVEPGSNTIELSTSLSQRYNLWAISFDNDVLGELIVDVGYNLPATESSTTIPLARPVCEGQVIEQVAIEAAEELALKIDATGAKDIDAIDLPPLPAAAERILAAFRLHSVISESGADTVITLSSTVHENYRIPAALATRADLKTYVGPRGRQQTEAQFEIANAGRQFLTMRLPKDAQLWSLSVNGQQAKPQRNTAGDYQVPLGRLGTKVRIKLVYAVQSPAKNLEKLVLAGVELVDVPANHVNWIVVPPPGHRIAEQHSRMQSTDMSHPTPAYRNAIRLLRDSLFTGPLFVLGNVKMGFAVQEAASAPQIVRHSMNVDDGETSMALGMPEPAPPTEEPMMQIEADEQSAPAKPKDQALAPQQPRQKAYGVRMQARGRHTLPVELVETSETAAAVEFSALGTDELEIGLARERLADSWFAVGFLLIVAVGLLRIRRTAGFKVILILGSLFAASIAAIWLSGIAYFANGVFWGALALIPLYVLASPVCRVCNRLRPSGPRPSHAAVSSVIVALICLSCGANAAAATPKKDRPETATTPDDAQVIGPYEGDPRMATNARKVLLPYSEFVKLWNRAHPEDRINGLASEADFSLADVRYTIRVSPEHVDVTLSAQVRTYGRDWTVLPLDLSGLAVVEAKLGDRAAQLQAGPEGTVLMIPSRSSGKLSIKAVARPNHIGRRGSISFGLPPMPAPVMEITLPEEDLTPEIEGLEGTLERIERPGRTVWQTGLGMTRSIKLSWTPKAGGGAADRTLSADSNHDVYVFHWAILGVSKIRYSFSGGQHDRFTLLLPEGMSLTDLEGTNLKDFRQTHRRTIEGLAFNVVEVRLHRPARKQYQLTARWLGGLGSLDEAEQVRLVRAGDVGRESGTVTLHAAGGMAVKVAQVIGGRRVNLPSVGRQNTPGSDRAAPVAKYYWAYRPFELSLELSRSAIKPQVVLDQLIRVATDRVEVLAQAKLKTEKGKLFGASFELPQGYELLSAVGPAVAKFYERSSDKGRFLHIKFNTGQTDTTLALVLVRRDVELPDFTTPVIKYIESEDAPALPQKGRLAIQIAASLEARTVASENLKSVAPPTLTDWLSKPQMESVQFAYTYEQHDPSLVLAIERQKTEISAEVFAGLVVRTTAAVYTYRLRYNVTGSPVDHLTFSLPSEYASLVAVQSPAMRNVTSEKAADGRTEWTVWLVNEVTGVIDIVANFALPVEESTAQLPVPTVGIPGLTGYTALAAIQNMSRHEISIAQSTNLRDLPLSEQQRLMPQAMREALQYVLQSFEEDWALVLDFEPAKTAERIQAVVDLLSITTVIDRAGRCRYEANLTLQNRSEQFLRVSVPDGLELWSGKVAHQAVKPVVASDSPQGEVLIPLVKTSPGGLPYEVRLYFADTQNARVVAPLDGIGRIKPPAISIVAMPVMRTTWSLRLPAGYKYMRPGGNMSAVAGTAEMLSLNIEAKLQQLSRLEKAYRDVAGTGTQREQVARSNWGLFNERLAGEIKKANRYLESNRSSVEREDYRRLQSKLGGQKARQETVVSGNTAYFKKLSEQNRNDMNFFLNSSVSNAGLAQTTRDSAITSVPEFVQENEERQIERLEEELARSQRQLQTFNSSSEMARKRDTAEVETAHGISKGKMAAAEDLVASKVNKKAEVDKLMTELSEEAAQNLDRKQTLIRNQLEELADNRLQRHFRGTQNRSQSGVSQNAPATRQPQPSQTPGGAAYQYGDSSRIIGEQMESVDGYALGRAGGSHSEGLRQNRVRADMDRATTVNGQMHLGTDQPAAAPQAETGGAIYTAEGTYSLPVALPAGRVRLDFARSAGDAELSVWAIPVATIHKLVGTIGVILAVLLLTLAVKFWPRPTRKQPLSKLRIGIYAGVIVILWIVLGLFGILAALLAITFAETKRGAFIGQRLEAI